MEEDFRRLVQACCDAFPRNGLTDDLVDSICKKRQLDIPQFYLAFAKHIALEFAYGEIGYGAGDCAINALVNHAKFEADSIPWEIFSAFDDGEFFREDDSEETIPWQKYTLPRIMELLKREKLLPRA